MSELEGQLRRMARAYPSDHWPRVAVVGVGLALAGGGVAIGAPLLGIVGGLCIGLTFSREPDRYYLEGFSDGLSMAPELAGADDARRRGGPAPAPEPRESVDERALDDAGRDEPAPVGAGPFADLGAALGIPESARYPRVARGIDGEPIVLRAGGADGPRPSSFPAIEPARPARPARSAGRGEARRGAGA